MNIKIFFTDILKFPFAKEIFSNNIEEIWEWFNKKDKVIQKINHQINCVLPKFYDFSDNIFIWEWTDIESFVKIEANVYIWRNVTIRSWALIRSWTIIWDNCVVWHNSEIKNSYIANWAKIQTNTFVWDSIIGQEARIGSWVITANRRFDQKDISLKINNEIIPTKRDKFWAIIGDSVRFWCCASTSPWASIWKNTWVNAGVIVSWFIQEWLVVKLRQTQEMVKRENITSLLSIDKFNNL